MGGGGKTDQGWITDVTNRLQQFWFSSHPDQIDFQHLNHKQRKIVLQTAAKMGLEVKEGKFDGIHTATLKDFYVRHSPDTHKSLHKPWSCGNTIANIHF